MKSSNFILRCASNGTEIWEWQRSRRAEAPGFGLGILRCGENV